ncbi:MAG: glycosyltransferase [Halobacteriovoraceae bacterium]|nr:glycosyltransferase [Halobacteriovoraceae bacterium]MBT5095551.1 glycosyltransferase [Halobacteriovoraceae bacterium]
MNIFFIPSWYPTESNPNFGIFCREQISCYANAFPDDNIFVSLWGQEDYFISPADPSSWGKIFSRNEESRSVRNESNLFELNTPVAHWSHRLGGLSQVTKANQKNFLQTKVMGHKIDLIHAHVSFPGAYLARKLSEQHGIPYLVTEHMSPFPFSHLEKHGKLIKELAWGLEKSSKIVCVSKHLEEEVNSYGLNETCVIPNFIDEDFFVIDSQNVNKSKKYFLTVGGMVPQKGIEDLVKVVSFVDGQIDPEIKFKIVGEGSELENYKKLAEEMRVGHRIEFLGSKNREELLELYQNCLAFILTSQHESFGLVYLEAMACGRPVLATRCGGPETFINEKNGLLFDVGDAPGISRGLLTFLEKLEQYDPQVIRKTFSDKFSKEVVTKEVRSLYGSIC